MNLQKLSIILPLLFISTFQVKGENIDSLKAELNLTSDDSIKIGLLNDIAWELLYSSPSEALAYGDSMLMLSQKTDNSIGQRSAYIVKGNASYFMGDLDKAISYYQQAKEICEKIDDVECVNATKLNLSSVYHLQGKYEESLKLKECETI